MPQMSPMSWLYLMIYFISLFLIIMLMIYNIIKFYDNKNKLNNFKKSLFKYLW